MQSHVHPFTPRLADEGGLDDDAELAELLPQVHR